MKKYLPLILSILAFFLPFGLYLRTLAPTYIPIDVAEFTLCMHFWGVCHSPGFPLYVMIGKFFTDIVPIGSLIYKANLLSAIYGAGTILFLYLALVEIKVRKGLSFLLALVFSVSGVFWEFSLSADVFTFSTLLIAISFFSLFKNRRNLTFFVLGLSASHFYISVVLAPIFCWYFEIIPLNLMKDIKKIKPFLLAILMFSAGFFPQIVMFMRMLQQPEISWGHVSNFSGFIDYLRRKEFGSIFLIANPVLTFSLVKMYKQFLEFYKQLAFDFLVILPLISIVAFGFIKFLKDRKVQILALSFFVLSSIQLFLLSTIDPTGADNPFQINKFYLTSFVIFILLCGMAVQYLYEKLFGNDQTYLLILISILAVIVLLANFKTHNYSKNYFTENFVVDGLSELPKGSIIITVDHPFYFGGLYEQKVNRQFENLTLLYFPNEKNRDSEAYHPEVFNRQQDQDFINKIHKGKNLGAAEEYVLLTIAKNLDRPIYILQGSFENNFFSFLKPYVVPWGLFWKVVPDQSYQGEDISARLANFKNQDFKKNDLFLRQQGFEAQTYAIAYFNSGHFLAVNGDLVDALTFFEKSLAIDSDAKSVSDERNFVLEIKKLADRFDQMVGSRDTEALNNLGADYVKLGAYQKAIETYKVILSFNEKDAQTLNNLASAYAYANDKESAVIYYREALKIDPNLELAKKGLASLEANNK